MPRIILAVVSAALVLCSPAAGSGPPIEIDELDQAWATAILPTEDDLPAGWHAVARTNTSDADYSLCDGLKIDESDLVVTGAAGSPDFIRGDGAWSGAVALVWRTAAQAQADWDRSVQPKLMNCVADSFKASSTKAVKIVIAGKRAVNFPAVAPRTAAYRISLIWKMIVRSKQRKPTTKAVRATYDLILIGDDRASATLATLSFKSKPLPDIYAHSLAVLMAQRMHRDPHS